MSRRRILAALLCAAAAGPASAYQVPARPGELPPSALMRPDAENQIPLKPTEFPPTGPGPGETKVNPLDFIIRNLRMTTPMGPLLFIPLIDTNKDTGLRFGMMPILALRDTRGDGIAAVVAPSVRYNRYLHTQYTWRTYFFPNDKELWVFRGSYSDIVHREVFLRYFNPEFLGTAFRLNAEFHLLRAGKFSFYGFGPESRAAGQANYSHYKIGEEFSAGLPLSEHVYLDLTHTNFHHKLGEGPITTLPQLGSLYPSQALPGWKRLIDHRVSLIYDSTDHPALPSKGYLLSASAKTGQTSLGSDYTYQTYAARAKGYFNAMDGKYVTAANIFLEQQHGDVLPFYAQTIVGESTGLRVMGDGRFTDRGRLVFNIEERFRVARSPILKFFSEVELSPFLDIGTVFHSPGEFRWDGLEPGPGLAARVLLRPQVVVTFDAAYWDGENNLIINVDYPF